MRFKSKLATEQVSLLYSLISAVAKLQDSHSNRAVLYVDPDFLRLSAKGENGVNCFAELAAKGGLFLDHRVESQAKNVIVMEVDLPSLKLALSSVLRSSRPTGNNTTTNNVSTSSALPSLASHVVILKLAKRSHVPCLCLDGANDAIEIHQAIPVRIMRDSEMQNHLPPQINSPTVQLELNPERPLRAIVEKLRAMGNHVYLEGSMKGDLTLRLDHDGASLACFYNHLVPRFKGGAAGDDDDDDQVLPDPNAKCTLKVDAQKLWTCLQWQQASSATTFGIKTSLLCMVENEMLVMHVDLAIGFFTYYIPVLFLQEDEIS